MIVLLRNGRTRNRQFNSEKNNHAVPTRKGLYPEDCPCMAQGQSELNYRLRVRPYQKRKKPSFILSPKLNGYELETTNVT